MCKDKKQKKNYLQKIDIVDSFRDSISADLDCLADFSESMIDSFISNPAVQSIPILKSGVALYKGAKSFYNYFQQKKLIMFLGQLRSCEDSKSIEKMRKKILGKPDFLYKESELTLAILDKAVEADKSILLAKIFATLIKESITEEIYCEMVLIINQIFLSDLVVLKKVQEKTDEEVRLNDISALNRLEANGLIYQSIIDENGRTYNDYELSSIGEKLCDVL